MDPLELKTRGIIGQDIWKYIHVCCCLSLFLKMHHVKEMVSQINFNIEDWHKNVCLGHDENMIPD